VVDANEVNQLLGNILLKTPRLGGVEVFPLGIPFPDIFRVNVVLGSPVEAGAIKGIAQIFG
jgi:hypothetical protein